ncbi:hypothetical protein, conserved [Eimeria tenella]|uniref:Uncharacterized protein n=1 Tax=Eimeria tenella TaxID=5802 RepID=U6KRY7_EIMTE|nr:hypothetical protein, conserved [Eimeria tenella]CDJ40877.1 hypothetical protein, conserved [Eimeria tenella]|eukprot:XP_013231627.1 hypothetical protein, conserved [Eimeria tenella]
MFLLSGVTQQQPQLLLLQLGRRALQQQQQQHLLLLRRNTHSAHGRLSTRLSLMLQRQQQQRQREQEKRVPASQRRNQEQQQQQQQQRRLSEEERKALLQQLLLRIDESFKQHHSLWLPRQSQRGGGRAAKPSLQRPWNPRKQQQQQQQQQRQQQLRGRWGAPAGGAPGSAWATQHPAEATATPAAAAATATAAAATPAAAAAAAAVPVPAVRRSEDLSALECLFLLLRLVRLPKDWQQILRLLQLLNNFGRLSGSSSSSSSSTTHSEIATRLAAAAALCKRHDEACAVLECSKYFLSSPPSLFIVFNLLEDALGRKDAAAADKLFLSLRHDWRLPISPSSYLLMLRAAVTPEHTDIRRCAKGPAGSEPAPGETQAGAAAEADDAAAAATAAAAEATNTQDAEAAAEGEAAADDEITAAEYLRMAKRVSVCMEEDAAAFNGRPLSPRALLLQSWLALLEHKFAADTAALQQGVSLLLAACAARVAEGSSR